MNIREKICVLLFEKSKTPYAKIFKRRKIPWKVSREELLNCNLGSLSWALGDFLKTNDFNLIPRLERHDAYHVLTGFGTEVKDEIALQFLCFGNGKRSKYLFFVIALGTLLNPEHLQYFIKSYQRGKKARRFYHWNFKNYLHNDLVELQSMVFDDSDPYSYWKPLQE